RRIGAAIGTENTACMGPFVGFGHMAPSANDFGATAVSSTAVGASKIENGASLTSSAGLPEQSTAFTLSRAENTGVPLVFVPGGDTVHTVLPVLGAASWIGVYVAPLSREISRSTVGF